MVPAGAHNVDRNVLIGYTQPGRGCGARKTWPGLGLTKRAISANKARSASQLMPILPLDHPEPFAATLGVMLYPGTDDLEKRKAAAFQMHWLSKPIERLHADGRELSYSTLLHLITKAGEELEDLDKRWWQATATGELLKTVFALYTTNPALASWNNAVKLAKLVAARERHVAKRPASRAEHWAARRRYLSVAHLWAAWCIREGRFETRPEIGYDGCADFGS